MKDEERLLIDSMTDVVHAPHPNFSAWVVCGLIINHRHVYLAPDGHKVTCLACLAEKS